LTTREDVIAYLNKRLKGHNARFKGVPGKSADLEMLKKVFSRGYFREKSFGTEEENIKIKSGIRRIKDFLFVMRNGYPRLQSDIVVTEDFDLLPKGHRLHAKWKTYHLVRYDYFTDSQYDDEFRNNINILDV
jgi:hypothetical protein